MQSQTNVGSSALSKKKVRRFMYHMYRVSCLRQERKLARSKLRDQLGKLRTMQISSNAQRQKLQREIKNLEQLISMVVEMEKKEIRVTPASAVAHARLQKKVNELYDKLSEYMLWQKKREDRIAEIEKKVRGDTISWQHPEMTNKILARIDVLENKYTFLKNQGLASPDQLEEIREKLEELRTRVL
jgi:hypothetical protein